MKKGIAGAILVGLAVRLVMLTGAGEALGDWVREATADGRLISATLNLEVGGGEKAPVETEEEERFEPAFAGEPESGHFDEREKYPGLLLVNVTPAPEAGEDEAPEIVATTISSAVSLRNDTGFDVDIAALAEEGLSLTLEEGEPQILIIHTHASEAYTQDPFNEYEESDAFRTEDDAYSVIRVGDELTEKLEDSGLTVIHDRGVYDYPSYTGSYTRSGEAVQSYLDEYPSIKIVIDLHRDALGTGDVVYKTKAEVSGQSCAQVMLLVGTGENGLYHPYWEENLKLALYLQNAMDARFPTLARPVALKQERYNQHLTTGSLILEVGSTGNTLQEALNAIDLFAEAAGPALAALVE